MRYHAILPILAVAFLAGCSGSAAHKSGVTAQHARDVIASVANARGPSFSLTETGTPKRSVTQMAAWLQKHPQPPAPDKKDHPKEGPGCESLSNPTQFISYVPTSVKMALVATESAPWAFVRFDIDENGNTYNLRPVRNSGFREFADASLITVSFWKYSGQPKALGLKDCTGLVQVTK